jgi:molecular chaperone DnaK (HSP70)
MEKQYDSFTVKEIGVVIFDGLTTAPAGEHKIDITFRIDENNILSVSMVDEDTEKEVVVRCDGLHLPDDELNRYHQLVQNWIRVRRLRE